MRCIDPWYQCPRAWTMWYLSQQSVGRGDSLLSNESERVGLFSFCHVLIGRISIAWITHLFEDVVVDVFDFLQKAGCQSWLFKLIGALNRCVSWRSVRVYRSYESSWLGTIFFLDRLRFSITHSPFGMYMTSHFRLKAKLTAWSNTALRPLPGSPAVVKRNCVWASLTILYNYL